MATAEAWVMHGPAKEKIVTGLVDFDGDAFVVRLYTSTSDIDDPTLNDASAITNELTTANGYTVGGTATSCTVSEVSGLVTVDFSDASWDASGGGITARYAALIDTTLTPDEVVAHSTLDTTPADVSAAAGNKFIVQFHSNGLFQLV
jgi:hypothetical protein